MAQKTKVAGDAGVVVEDVRSDTGLTAPVAPIGAAPVVEEVRSDAGQTLHVEGLGAAAVALGEAVAVGDGGPGVGATRIAEALDGPAIRDVPVEDDAALRSRREAYRRDTALAVAAVAQRTGRDEILPLGRPTLDPTTVPGRKIATAAAQVRRDGRSYVPGETFAIDFRAHSELTQIGAIVAELWHDLPDAT